MNNNLQVVSNSSSLGFSGNVTIEIAYAPGNEPSKDMVTMIQDQVMRLRKYAVSTEEDMIFEMIDGVLYLSMDDYRLFSVVIDSPDGYSEELVDPEFLTVFSQVKFGQVIQPMTDLVA